MNNNEKILEIKKINKIYKGNNKKLDLHIIKNLDLLVHKGELMSIIGKSGSGKSTLLNIMGMLDDPDNGEVYIAGKLTSGLREKEKDQLRNIFLGFVFQFHYLLPEFTALENVMLPAMVNKFEKNTINEIRLKAENLLYDVGLQDRKNHKPTELSGGEKQRVAIARGLVNSPKILLADEPTGNLDSETSEQIHEILKKINKEKNQTIIVVTHSSELAQITDRKMLLKMGSLHQI